MPANPQTQGHLRIIHQRKGRGWNRGFVVKACLSISLKWNLYNFKGGSSVFIEAFMLSWKGQKKNLYSFILFYINLFYYYIILIFWT